MFEDKVVGTLRRFYRDIQHDDPVEFGLGELISPDSKRHRRFISTFLNYWHFNTSTYDDMTGAREAVEGEARDMRAMEEDVKKLGEQGNRFNRKIGFSFGLKNGLRFLFDSVTCACVHYPYFVLFPA